MLRHRPFEALQSASHWLIWTWPDQERLIAPLWREVRCGKPADRFRMARSGRCEDHRRRNEGNGALAGMGSSDELMSSSLPLSRLDSVQGRSSDIGYLVCCRGAGLSK